MLALRLREPEPAEAKLCDEYWIGQVEPCGSDWTFSVIAPDDDIETFVYASETAAVCARGPYLLPQDTDLRDNARQRIRIEAILDQLAKLPASQKKLLILDTSIMPDCPRANTNAAVIMLAERVAHFVKKGF